MNERPAVSLIIPTRNRPRELRACLDRLMPQLPSDGSVGVMVCDDSDGGATAEMLRRDYPQISRILGPRIGPGANRNAGAAVATAPWLIFLDDDCLPAAALLESYLEAMRRVGDRREVVLAGATFRIGPHEDSILWEAPHSPTGTGATPSCNFAIRREFFLEVGGFDERFRIAFEDMEFFSRVRLMGAEVEFVGAAAIDHPSRRVPPPATLARRWEARVVSSYDFGATTAQIAWRLPRHILLVILSRFRGRRLSTETLAAGAIFLGEFVATLYFLPGWIWHYRLQPRSVFWVEQVRMGMGPPRFGL